MSMQALRSRPAVAGLVYLAAWVAGLTLFSADVDLGGSGSAVISAYAGHEGAAALQSVLVHGVAALALLGVVLPLGRRARSWGAGRAITVAGSAAAAISLVQCALGLWLAGAVARDDAGASGVTYHLINRLDGLKMVALGALAVAGVVAARRVSLLPRWLVPVGIALAASIAVSAVGYLLLLAGPAVAAFVSLPLLLVWVTASGVAYGRASAPRPGRIASS